MSTNTLIISRPGIGKTQKAIEYYIDNVSKNINGIYIGLEMSSNQLIERILRIANNKNIKLSDSINELLVTDRCFSFSEIFDYINSIEEKVNFIIIDYLQLLSYRDMKEFDFEMFNLFKLCREKNIDVVLLSQLTRGIINKKVNWTEAVLSLATPYNYFLKYIDNGYFLTETYGEIYCDDMKSVLKKIENDIVNVISKYIKLEKSGENYKCCCPFHSEKTPSFIISPEKQIFHCFGCGVGGNYLDFLKKIKNENVS